MQQDAQRHHGQGQGAGLLGGARREPLVQGETQVIQAADAANAEPAEQAALPVVDVTAAYQQPDAERPYHAEQGQTQRQRAPVPMQGQQRAEQGHQQHLEYPLEDMAEGKNLANQQPGGYLRLRRPGAEPFDGLGLRRLAALGQGRNRVLRRNGRTPGQGDFGVTQANARGKGGEKAPGTEIFGDEIGQRDQCQGEKVVGRQRRIGMPAAQDDRQSADPLPQVETDQQAGRDRPEQPLQGPG